jgi:hypothetical protein
MVFGFSHSSAPGQNLRIPATVRLGITGNPKLASEQLIRTGTRRVLTRLDEMLHQTPHTFVVISPLAQLADRLMVKEVLAWPVSEGMDKPRLEVVLPLSLGDYVPCFDTEESKREFKELLAKAKSRHKVEKMASPEAAYEQASRYVVDTCDVLVLVWDGKPLAGQGNAELLGYARKAERSLFLINPKDGTITEERREDNSLQSLKHLDAYNSESLSNVSNSIVEAQFNALAEQAKNSGVTPDFLNPLREGLLVQFVRADLLAQRYQNRHFRAGSTIYALAAAAVATVTTQVLFFEHLPGLLWLEVAEMIFILLLLTASRIGHWHRKWIDYRSLAERLRAAVFWRVANIRLRSFEPPPQVRFPHWPGDWIARAFAWVWNRPTETQHNREIPFESLKNFLLASWIAAQASYYSKRSSLYRQRHTQLSLGGNALFVLTLIVAIVHATGLAHSVMLSVLIIPNMIVSLAIILPAVAAALAGVRVHREYLRTAEQYGQTARYLSAISGEIRGAPDMKKLAVLLKEANEAMLREHWRWREAFLFRKLETP